MTQVLIDGLYRVVCPVDGVPADMRVVNHEFVSCSHSCDVAECSADCRAREHLRDPERAQRIEVECPGFGGPAEILVRHGRVEGCSLNPKGCDHRCLGG